MPAIFSFGYSGIKGPDALRALLGPYGVDTIVDIRMSPASRWVRMWDGVWNSERTAKAAGFDYLHVQALGNTLYRSSGIKILVPERVDVIYRLLEEGKVPALMCTCASPAECHRTEVVRIAVIRYPGSGSLLALDLPIPKPVLPPPPTLGL